MKHLLAFLLSCVASGLVFAGPPNIVLIFTDDQGYHDVGCYGSEIATPHIDSLARDGVKFTQFYSASAICTPSRFGLLTGRNPSRSQDRLLSALMFLADEHKNTGIQKGETTVAEVLRKGGYQTALLGKWHLGHGGPELSATSHGFDYFYGHTAGCIDFFTMCYGNTPDWYRNDTLLDETGYATDLITDEVGRYLDDRDKEKPFFLFLPYNSPHFGKGWNDGKNEPVNILQPHPRDLGRVMNIKDSTRRKYAGMVVSLDDAVGRVLADLKKRDLEENTLVIFMTDHGGDPNYGGDNKPFRDGKATLFEGGIRVPCLARWPGQIKAGSESDALIWAIDWFPTFCKLAGIETKGLTLDGEDISPVLRGGKGDPGRELFWELGAHAELERGNWYALRKGDWKYVATPENGEWLFNLAKDPGEKMNVINKESKRHVRMKGRADELAREYLEFSRKMGNR